ncbi:hypothetical protein [Priestia megaterium]|uniref:hypothetical protein n=1 Tax=Priestia megaterium TaxID=1404 RepID=UPI000BFE9891|nr:hypothetical protein [Priestia megaterium]PGO60634.1 hypothetical protein CN981_08780 [Priestia megaterium]
MESTLHCHICEKVVGTMKPVFNEKKKKHLDTLFPTVDWASPVKTKFICRECKNNSKTGDVTDEKIN